MGREDMLPSLQGSIILFNLRMSPTTHTKPMFNIAQAHNKGGIEQFELRQHFSGIFSKT